jgi:hypothetical protein
MSFPRAARCEVLTTSEKSSAARKRQDVSDVSKKSSGRKSDQPYTSTSLIEAEKRERVDCMVRKCVGSEMFWQRRKLPRYD